VERHTGEWASEVRVCGPGSLRQKRFLKIIKPFSINKDSKINLKEISRCL
jgi:hypothetical protein